MITLVSGSAILLCFPVDLASVSSLMNSYVVLLKARALIMCLNTNFID
jgi:hypothetical protein